MALHIVVLEPLTHLQLFQELGNWPDFAARTLHLVPVCHILGCLLRICERGEGRERGERGEERRGEERAEKEERKGP